MTDVPVPEPATVADLMKIPLTHGKVAIVDASDYEKVASKKWRAEWDGHNWYVRHSGKRNGKSFNLLLHRFLLDLRAGDPPVDHVNGNGLDNRRKNLRLSDWTTNTRNRRRPKNNTTGFKGVQRNRYCKTTGKPFLAVIKVNGKRTWMGPFVTAEEAARAYDEKARELFGEFARCNFREDEQL